MLAKCSPTKVAQTGRNGPHSDQRSTGEPMSTSPSTNVLTASPANVPAANTTQARPKRSAGHPLPARQSQEPVTKPATDGRLAAKVSKCGNAASGFDQLAESPIHVATTETATIAAAPIQRNTKTPAIPAPRIHAHLE